jgi:hypothetical protein
MRFEAVRLAHDEDLEMEYDLKTGVLLPKAIVS